MAANNDESVWIRIAVAVMVLLAPLILKLLKRGEPQLPDENGDENADEKPAPGPATPRGRTVARTPPPLRGPRPGAPYREEGGAGRFFLYALVGAAFLYVGLRIKDALIPDESFLVSFLVALGSLVLALVVLKLVETRLRG